MAQRARMLPGLAGTLLSGQFAALVLPKRFTGRLGETTRDAAWRSMRRWWASVAPELGPASSVRTLFDRAAAPLASFLGFRVGGVCIRADGAMGAATLLGPESIRVSLLVTTWGEDLGRLWRDAVGEGIREDAAWCLCLNARQLRVVDARRTYARVYLEFDLESTLDSPDLFAVFWGLLRADAFGAGARPSEPRALLDEVSACSNEHAVGVCRSLQEGVDVALLTLVQALAAADHRGSAPPTLLRVTFEHALIIIYRILFLLFAEARGLVPVWHPVYRANYTVDALARLVERGVSPRGLWDALQAITRLAHAGCNAGDLRVTAFNGRLFSPIGLARPASRGRRARRHRDRLVPDRLDQALQDVLTALTSRPATGGSVGRERVAYGDLGVEQLGAVYERVLDYEPAKVLDDGRAGAGQARRGQSAPLVVLHRSGRRKATGTFYTPRPITDFLVRRALQPLVRDAAPEAILTLRVLDAAMGSGAFLVSACRYLAAAYEGALVRSGACHASDVSEEDRAGFRRLVAQRCLFGVDLNPMAVQLGRLSLWLATLAADRPLTFLDHHLRVGNSLVGASLDDLRRQPPPGHARRRARVPQPLPLLDVCEADAALRAAQPLRRRLAQDPDASLESVRQKERVLAALSAPDAPLSRWRAVADLWCAAWFWDDAAPPGASEFGALADQLLGRRTILADHVARPRLEQARQVAEAHAFFHWTLEFPEVFYDDRGQPRADAGFDAVVGNPPWDMLRGDDGPVAQRAATRRNAGHLLRFARAAGIYRAQAAGHANLYQLFLERALGLLRPGGRLALVLPAGLATDRGSALLRRRLFDGCELETLISFDNRDAVFPIHRSLRFLLLIATRGGTTPELHCRFGERSPEALDRLPDSVSDQPPDALPVVLTRALLDRLSPGELAIPHPRGRQDLAILESVSARLPRLSDAAGWDVQFGRELNLTDDRAHLCPPGGGLPVVEGKHLGAFRVAVEASRFSVPSSVVERLLDRARTFDRPRLAYRDVSSVTNRRTLIAAIVPAGVVTAHTIFCLKTSLDLIEQHALCGLLNSYVADYLVRQRIGTHLSTTIVEALPVPYPPPGSPTFRRLARLTARLIATPADSVAEAQLQAEAARLYGLAHEEFTHILGTFPLVEATRRAAAAQFFSQTGRTG